MASIPQEQEPLAAAINLAKQGKKKEARLKFMEIIKDDPHEVMAYLWLVDLLDRSEEKVALLERCLLLNPGSQMAQDALDVVLEQQMPEIYDEYELPKASMAVYKDEPGQKKPHSFKKILKPLLWVSGLSLAVVLLLLGVRYLPDLFSEAVEATEIAGGNAPAATWTPPATPTPTMTPTGTPALPVGFGTPLPPPAAMISAYDIQQLTVFAQWGTGIPLAAHWMPDGNVAALTSRSVEMIDTDTEKVLVSFGLEMPIQVGDVCPAQEIAALQTADGMLHWLDFQGDPVQNQPLFMEQTYRSLVYSPDCTLLAGIAVDGSLVIWQTSSGEVAMQLGTVYGQINALAFSQDHGLIGLGTDRNITWVIDTETGEELSRIVETTEGVDAIAFSEDGKRIATASQFDQTVSIWNIEENRRFRTIALDKAGVISLAYGRNGDLLAIGYVDGEIILRDEAAREIVGRFNHYQSEITSLEFDENSGNLLSVGIDGRLLSWKIDTTAGKTVFYAPIEGSIFTADISPNGQYLAMGGSDSQIHIFDVASQAEVASLRGHLGSVWYIDISTDGNYLLSGGRDGSVRLWSLETYEQVALLGSHGGYVRGVAFSPDGKYGVSASADEMVKVWDLDTMTELHTLVGHVAEVQYAFFSPDSSQVYSLGDDGSLRKWDRASGRMLSVMEGDDDVAYLSGNWLPDQFALVGNENGEIDLWNLENQNLIYTFTQMDGEVLTMDVTADSSILATGSDTGEVILWDILRQDQVHVHREHSDPVVGVAFSANGREFVSVDRDGKTVVWDMSALPLPSLIQQYQPQVQAAVLNAEENLSVIAGADGSVQVVDLQAGQVVAQIKGSHAAVPEKLALSPGGTYLAAAIEDGFALVLWDLTSGDEVFTLAEDARVTGLLFEPGGRVLMTARSNHTIERRDIRSGTVLEVMRGHSSPVQVMAFAPNGVTMASGAQDGMIFIWDMDDNSILQRINAHTAAVSGLQFSADGNWLYSSSTDGKLQMWRVSNGELEMTLADESDPLMGLTLLEGQRLISAVVKEDDLGFWTDASIPISSPLEGFWGKLKAVQFRSDGSQMLVVDGDGIVQSLQIAESIAPSAEEIAAAMASPTPESAVQESVNEPATVGLQTALPAPVYYLSDASGSAQVWRLETDGVTTKQITFESYPVTSFDVAQGTDHLAFVSNNDLILTDKSGSSRWVIQDGELYPPNAQEEAQRKAISDLNFSPDGWRLSYALNGVHVYSILNDNDTSMIENRNLGTDAAVVYRPLTFSPGGNNLYIQIEEGSELELMVVNSWTGELYAEFGKGPCCQPHVNAEQDAIYFTGQDAYGNAVGLWLADIWNDTIETILPETGSQINAWPIQDPFTEQLIFFYAVHQRQEGVPVSMARAADDGVSLLQVIRADSFSNLSEVLWAPDASMALISDPATFELTILYPEDRPAISLGIQGTMMRWGN
ncbi:MAG: hypothetical protein V2J07_05490 [Anaerolineae bacterium]|jgi:WD40 repeat protein|nr:hypothetical protein [Anaerolineae bacterium]